MSRAPLLGTRLRGLGGPDLVSWPAFLVTWVLGLFGHFAAAGDVQASALTRVGIVTAAQCAMFLPLVVLRFTLLRPGSRARPLVGLFGVVVAGVLRGLTIGLLLMLTGASSPQWVYRAASGVVGYSVVLAVCALIVHAYRERSQELERLAGLNGELAATAARSREQVAVRNEATVARVRALLEAELIGLSGTTGAGTVRTLQRLAADVVRPLSHSLEHSLPGWQPDAVEPGSASVRWHNVVEDLLTGRPLRPATATAFLVLILFVTGLSLFPQHLVVVLALFAFVLWGLLTLANCALQPVLDPRRLVPSSLLLVLCTSVASLAALLAAGLPLPGDSVRWRLVTFGAPFAMIDVLLVSFWFALRAEQERLAQRLRCTTKVLRRDLALLHQADRLHNKALARALHGPVQSAATAAAIRLEQAYHETGLRTEVVAETERTLQSALDVLDGDAGVTLPLDEALARICLLWDGVCEVRVEVSPDTVNALRRDVAARTAVIEIITDAVSNAVRHGRARHVDVALTGGADVLLSVGDDGDDSDDRNGRQERTSVAGLGTKVLDECATDWERTATRAGQRLTAVIPTGERP